MKDRGPPIRTARSQPRQAFTLTATRVNQQFISSLALTTMRKKQLLRLSLGSPLKDRGSTRTDRSKPRQVINLATTQVSQQPISDSTLMAIRERAPQLSLREPPERQRSPTRAARSRPKQIFTLMATRLSQQPISGIL